MSMSEVALAAPRRPETQDTAFTAALRGVLAWHLVLAVLCIYILVNVIAAVWSLGALPRTALAVIAVVGLLLNLLAVPLLARGRHVGRGLSFTVLYTSTIGTAAMLAETLGLFEGLDEFAGAFENAFGALVLVAVGTAWWVMARRIGLRIGEATSAARAAGWLGRVGLVAVAAGAALWLWRLDLPAGLTYVLNRFNAAPALAIGLLFVAVGSGLAARAIWSRAAADHFGATAKQSERMVGWLYLSPNLIGFLAFFAFPLIFSLVISFFRWDGLTTPTFAGLSNYAETLSSRLFWQSLANIGWFLLLAVPLAVVPALFLAVLIHTNYTGVKAFRAIFFIPSVAGVIGVTLIWKRLFNAQTGSINWAIGELNSWINAVLPGDPLPERVEIGWLSDPSTVPFLPDINVGGVILTPSIALITVVIVFAWSQFGFNTVLFSAGLQSIGRELYEAAELDGANAWQQFRNITVPSLRSTTFFVVATTVILSLQLFDIVYALNQPNPVGFPNNATLTPVVYLYQLGFQQSAFGLASAVAWVLFIVIFAFTLLQFRQQRRDVEGP